MIDTNTAAGWCSHTHTHMQTHTYPASSDAHAYACPLWFMHPGGGVSLSESKADTQVSSFVNQLPIYGCVCVIVCVSLWMFVPINLCVWIEVSIGNGLIITVTPSFVIFIEFFPVSALGVCKSLSVHSVCVCVCIPSLQSADYYCQPVLWPRSLQQEVTQLSDLSYYSQERLGKNL